MKDSNGVFFKSCYDVPMCLNICELSGVDRIYFNNSKKIYLYNRDSEFNDDKINQNLQTSIHLETLKRPALKRIDSYKNS